MIDKIKKEIILLNIKASLNRTKNLENNLEFNYWCGFKSALEDIEDFIKNEE